MKDYIRYGMLLLATALLVGVRLLGASPTTIKSMNQFDDLVTNPAKPVTVVLALSQPEKMERTTRKQLETARRGFNDLSKQKLYKHADVQFIVVNLNDFPSLQKEFDIKELQDGLLFFVVYHKGNKLGTQAVTLLDDDDVKAIVAEKGQRYIEKLAGTILDDIVQEKADREFELAKARAQAPVYYSPFYYDPWWGYGWGYGYGYRWGCGGYWW